MRKLHINFMNNLQNYEFAKLYEQLCSVVEIDQLHESHAKKAYMTIIKHAHEIDYIDNDSRSHELTSIINGHVSNRTDYLRSLRMQVDGLKLSFCDEERAAALLLSSWLYQQGKSLYAPSIITQSRLVDNLMHVRTLDNELDEAIVFLGLDRHINAIVDINKVINTNFIQRTKEMAAASKKSRAIRKAAYHDLKIFVSVINLFVEMSAGTTEDTIYHQYSREINNLLTHYHTKLKSRTTKRKIKNEISTAVNKLISEQKPHDTTAVEVAHELKSDIEIIKTTPIINRKNSGALSSESKIKHKPKIEDDEKIDS